MNRLGLRRFAGALVLVLAVTFLCGVAGCAAPVGLRTALVHEIELAARPLLEMQPDANWTACHNRLLALGPASIDYIVSRPVMRQVAAPDDLRVMLHTSLLRLLANPAEMPRLSVNCFETTLDLVHFEPKVRGRRLGEVCLLTERLPASWLDLYPAEFDHTLAREIDVECDRRAVLHWWEARRGEPGPLLRGRPLQPRPEYVWNVLSRRYADVWVYEMRPETALCAYPPSSAALLRGRTRDYNLVRAACIWLASSRAPDVQRDLIELVAHPSPVVAYNARFALVRSWDPAIRKLLERYEETVGDGAPPELTNSRRVLAPVAGDT
jgi:hypothetical protein